MPIRDMIWTGTGFDTIDSDTVDGSHSTQLKCRGTLDALSGGTKPSITGASTYQCYNNANTPETYGNVLTLFGEGAKGGAGELFLGWSGASTEAVGQHAGVYVRSQRDVAGTLWSDWARVYTTAYKPTAADVGAATSTHTHTAAQVGAIPTTASCNKNWNWSGQGGQPSWLWGGNDGTNMYVYNPSNFSVNYANSAGSASSANTANSATTAGTANHLHCTNYGVPIEIGQYIDFHAVGSNVDYSIRLEGTSGQLTCHGNFTASKVYNAVWNDYAELFEKEEDGLTAGDILAWGDKGVVKATIENKNAVVGVFSDTFGHLLGGEKGKTEEENMENYSPVGLSGRVYVKVTGTIKKGDLIVASDIPGVGCASKGYEPGTVVGKALEAHEGDEVKRIQMLIMNI